MAKGKIPTSCIRPDLNPSAPHRMEGAAEDQRNHPEHPLPQREVRLDPKEGLTERDEGHNMEDPLRRQVMEAEA
jgi:hypothetical protein